jgi:hypothetical protein
MSLTVKIDRNALPALGPKLRRAVSQVVRKTALDIEANAKVIVPVDTGFLKSSIQAEPVGPLTSEIQVGAEYGAIVEFGSSRQAPRAYLTPSVETLRPVFPQAIAAVVAQAAREEDVGG